VLVALAVAFFIKEVPLGTRNDATTPAPAGPAPGETETARETALGSEAAPRG